MTKRVLVVEENVLRTIVEALVFTSSCDVIGNSDKEFSEATLSAAETLISQLDDDEKVFEEESKNVSLLDEHNGQPMILEQPELADRIRTILRVKLYPAQKHKERLLNNNKRIQ